MNKVVEMSKLLVERGKAAYAAIYLQTYEDQLAMREVKKAADILKRRMFFWTAGKGLLEDGKKSSERLPDTETPYSLCNHLLSMPAKSITVLRGFHHYLDDPLVQASLLDIIPEYKLSNRMLVVSTPVVRIPPELEKEFALIEMGLPTEEALTAVLDGILNSTTSLRANQKPNEERRKQLIDSAKGLTTQEAESAFSLSIIEPKEEGKEGTELWEPKIVMREKCLALRKNGILEYIRGEDGGMGMIGGLDNLKEYVAPLQKAFTPAAIQFGLTWPKGILLVGPPGCLSGDTEIVVNRAGNGVRKKLKDVVRLFNGGYTIGGSGSKRYWNLEIPTMLQSRDSDGNIRLNRLVAAVSSGVKKTYTLTTESGKQIRATADHRFLALRNGDWGWLELRALQPGSVVCSNHGMLSGTKSAKKDYPCKEGMRHHPYAVHDLTHSHGEPRKRHRYRVPTHRLVVEAAINELTFTEYMNRVRRGATWGLTFLGPDVEVHHRDRNTKNYSLSNLEILPKLSHRRKHGYEESIQNVLQKSGPDTVVSIVENSEEEVFDLTMEDPLNNFVANGIIVHNCAKSLAAKAISSTLGMPLLKLDMGRIFQSLVGSSEANVRLAIRVAEAVAPCILWMDEIEKGVAGSGSGALDSGVSARVLGTLLTWMQEKQSSVFVVATANDVTMLPPELLRKGRFDEMFSVDIPTRKERREILDIHIRKRKRGHLIDNPGVNQIDLDHYAGETSEGFTGAEIEGVIEQAMRVAFHNNRELNPVDLQDSFDSTQPISKTMQERLNVIRSWCKARTRPANKVENTHVSAGSPGRKVEA